MHSTVRQHLEAMRKVEKDLPFGDCFWVVSIEDKSMNRAGGGVSQVNRAHAARVIKQGTHRLATEEETAAYDADLEQQTEQARYERYRVPGIRSRQNCVALEPRPEPQPEPKKKQGR